MDENTKDQYLVQIGALKSTMLTMRNQLEVLTELITGGVTIETAGFEELSADDEAQVYVIAYRKQGATVKRHSVYGLCFSHDNLGWKQIYVIEQKAELKSDQPDFYKHFVGPDSLFSRFLAPEVIEGGQGILRPAQYADSEPPFLTQFSDDISTVVLEKLPGYATGFYRNRTTKNIQFFINIPSLMMFIDMLPNHAEPTMILVGKTGPVKVPVSLLDVSAFANLHVMLEAAFERLSVKSPIT